MVKSNQFNLYLSSWGRELEECLHAFYWGQVGKRELRDQISVHTFENLEFLGVC
jgi:hypothetical protein